MSAHTPGPWGQVDYWRLHDKDAREEQVRLHPDWRCIEGGTHDGGFVHISGHFGDANARLIAAAPDLLSIAKQWAAIDGGAWHVERHAAEKAELLADTRAAIAKAQP